MLLYNHDFSSRARELELNNQRCNVMRVASMIAGTAIVLMRA